ncbi:hypothetical protein CYMTET_46116 [Cymbomonas tetramitiformis]|uniref:Uncharacterized protein n=1 Tax=Cymbomonas tetramitiformis TaxID=36881 RepID=A0AAE0BYN4_9CHLO|nr:hypothetical protein CYMTET_46116 [Cymbomonas tetramitiformis]
MRGRRRNVAARCVRASDGAKGYSLLAPEETEVQDEAVGGALSMMMASNSLLHVYDSRLENNTALAGGGIYLSGQTKGWDQDLRRVAFHNNLAGAGECFYWIFQSNVSVPMGCNECNCNETYASSVVSYHAQQLLEVDGVSRWMDIDLIEAASNHPIEPPVRYVARDYYGSIVQGLDGGESVVATITSNSSMDSDLFYTVGASVVLYEQTGAHFEGLVLAGTPGNAYTLSFDPAGNDAWEPVSIQVRVRECVPGEMYDSKSQTCTECAPGYLKFGNGTAACVECTSDLIDCKGGSRYYIEQGAWVSPGVEKCANKEEAEVTQCFLDYIYECTSSSKCESDAAGREYDGLDVSTGLTLCRTGHRSVVMCGECQGGYQSSINNGECFPCGNSSLVQTVMVLLGLCCCAALLWVVLLQASRGKFLNQKTTHTSVTATTVFGVIFGYAQVLGPTIEMFGSDMPTILYRSLSTPLSLIQLPLAWMTQLQCTTHGLAGEEDDSDTEQVVSAFLVEHVVMACMPWLVVLVFGMILVTLHLERRASPPPDMSERAPHGAGAAPFPHVRASYTTTTGRGPLPPPTMVMTTTEQRRPPKMSRRNGANVSHIVVSLDTVNKDIEELGIRKGACVAAISLLLTLLYPTVGIAHSRPVASFSPCSTRH